MVKLGLEIKRLNNLISRNICNLKTLSMLNEVSNSNGFILRYLEENEDKIITQKDIEISFGITRSTTSTVLSLMEEKELIKREVMSSDNRVKRIFITEKGKNINLEIKKELEEFENKLMTGFSSEEINVFLDFIERLKNNVSKEEK